MPVKLLIPRQQYLASGIHMGMKLRTEDMKEFIYKIRPDGLAVLNLRKIDERIRIASKFLARAKNIVVASKKSPVQKGVKKFAELIKAQAFVGRFLPGTLTNPSFKNYMEADVVFILDPMIDKQALEEAVKARVPVVAVCNSFNETRNVDLIIPANNKGKRALATLLWLLAREILKERGEIKSDRDFKVRIEDFEKE
jgi:small subunit ribosomal protein S2